MACCFACHPAVRRRRRTERPDRSTAAELEGQPAGGFCSNRIVGRRSRRALRALGGDSHKYAHGRRNLVLRRPFRVSWADPLPAVVRTRDLSRDTNLSPPAGPARAHSPPAPRRGTGCRAHGARGGKEGHAPRVPAACRRKVGGDF